MINLLSDTVTQPCNEMRKVIANASVGDDVFGEDPTVNRLEALGAEMFGKTAALFCPSGTMTNQIALKVHTQPLDEVWCDEMSHIYQYETAGYSFHSGVGLRMIRSEKGILSVENLKTLEHDVQDWLPVPRSIVLENTCNKGGGTCYDIQTLEEIFQYAQEKQMSLHIDGARIFNAMLAKGYSGKEVGASCDSISVCLSKGLGAPVGSLLIGESDLIREARRIRKVMGGGMRQAGILAAAGIYALENNIERLEEDHVHAIGIAKVLLECAKVKQVVPVETNIIIFDLEEALTAKEFVQEIRKQGVLCSAFGPRKIRLVTHKDVGTAQIDQALEILKRSLN